MERIARVAFDAALKRGKRLCSVEKSNVLEVGWACRLGGCWIGGSGGWNASHGSATPGLIAPPLPGFVACPSSFVAGQPAVEGRGNPGGQGLSRG